MHIRLLFLSVAWVIFSGNTMADDSALPGKGWPATRYETLWTKSPFSVATPEAAQGSTEYSLWGILQIDGVSYASLTEKQSNDHFLLGNDKPVRGLTLVSIKRGNDSSDSQAVIQKDGQSIVLKLEQAPASGVPMGASPGMPAPMASQPPMNPNVQGMPGGMPNNINGPPGSANGPAWQQMPGGAAGPAGQQLAPPFAMRRTPVIHMPQHPPPSP